MSIIFMTNEAEQIIAETAAKRVQAEYPGVDYLESRVKTLVIEAIREEAARK